MHTDQMSPLKSLSKTLSHPTETYTVTQRCILSIKGRTIEGKISNGLSLKMQINAKQPDKVQLLNNK